VFALKPVGHQSLGYYRFHAAPGQTIHGQVRIINAGKVAGSASLSAVDATTGATTGAVYETVGGRSADVGAWLAVDSASVTLAPGASQVVGFTVTVPGDARRGQHLGGLVARPANPQANRQAGKAKHNFRVTIVDQSILAVQVDLPGVARGLLAVRGVQAGGNPGYQTLELNLSNPGEKMVKGSGVVTITSRSGAAPRRQPFTIDTFLPRTRIAYPVVMRGKALVPGDYRATVELRWDGGHSSRAEFPFTVSRHNIVQAYGSKGLAQLPGGKKSGGSSGMLLIAGAAVLLLLLAMGAMVAYFRRRTRELEARFTRDAPPADGEVAVRDRRARVES
jgi:hypothetical protein